MTEFRYQTNEKIFILTKNYSTHIFDNFTEELCMQRLQIQNLRWLSPKCPPANLRWELYWYRKISTENTSKLDFWIHI